ncbi:MAG: ABC transporter ATP-binding protein [Actinobacteria bacterium]|nr:ABC transporter ATP-binding protein [Actinomycetota bacterium]
MAKITLSNIGHSYNKDKDQSTWALKPIDMVWESGKTYALLGPSGCGKTTILNTISGLITPHQGRLLFDDKDVTDIPTAQRNIAQVFQFPTIYRSMSVFENLSFPLVCRGWKADKIKARVHEIAEILDITDKLGRSAVKLGADEKQLISLGRGLVRDDVSALLMDEPLTVIDPQSKFELRKKIKAINKINNLTVIYVTHDQYEAMTFADELLVMSFGEVIQRGTPEQLFEKPNSKYVGNFIGSPAMNFLPVESRSGEMFFGSTKLQVKDSKGDLKGKALEVGIRPEYVSVASAPGENVLEADLLGHDDLGSVRVLKCISGGAPISVKIPRSQGIPASKKLHLKLPSEKLWVYQDGNLA